MAIYIAIPLAKSSEALNNVVEEHIAQEDRYHLQDDRGWLIRYKGTSVELSNYIELTGQNAGDPSPAGSAIIVPVTTYYGRGPGEMWEWLKTRIEL